MMTRSRARAPMARKLSWLAVASLTTVAIFAPELKTPVPVSVAKVSAALGALRS